MNLILEYKYIFKNNQIIKKIIFIIFFSICISFLVNSTNANENFLNPKLGEAKLPESSLFNHEKVEININDFKSKNIILNFWASWCAPCLEELPSLSSLAKEVKKNDIIIILVNLDKSKKTNLTKFLNGVDINYVNLLYDPEAKWAKKLNISGLPTTLLINKVQNKYYTHLGPLNWDDPIVVKSLLKHFVKQNNF